MPTERILLSSDETAKALGVSTRTLYNLRMAGGLPYVALGSRIMFDPADLRHWIEAKKTQQHAVIVD